MRKAEKSGAVYRKAGIAYEPHKNAEFPYFVTITEKSGEILGIVTMKIIKTKRFKTEKEALEFAKEYKVNMVSRYLDKVKKV